MHKTFYVSGFLYHLPTQKILLQQNSAGDDSVFSLFSGKNRGTEDERAVFQHAIYLQLGITLPLPAIRPIYDYFHKELKKNHFISYAQATDAIFEQDFRTNSSAQWFTEKQISKLQLPQQTRHDIIIGKRVILAELTEKEILPVVTR